MGMRCIVCRKRPRECFSTIHTQTADKNETLDACKRSLPSERQGAGGVDLSKFGEWLPRGVFQ
jgi:hypothetical protein